MDAADPAFDDEPALEEARAGAHYALHLIGGFLAHQAAVGAIEPEDLRALLRHAAETAIADDVGASFEAAVVAHEQRLIRRFRDVDQIAI